ncbi:MAG: GlsB/YeaQ/YmgE family stress response membrane protein [Armatimonadetes bacterium]|nr:GlsB/YeaQ/YmgE family stress response membrane protein [Armatimonadota bacterium]
MSFLIFLVVGLIAGALAKAIMPGGSNEPGGWFLTMILGVVGAFVGGLIGGGTSGTFSIMGIVWATLGAIVLIGIMRLVTGAKRSV